MSDVVFQGGISGAWYHFAGGDIARVASYPTGGPAPFAGVAGTSTATATNGLTLPTPVDDMLLDQWLRVSKWSVSLSVPEPSTSAIEGAFDLDFEVSTGRTASVFHSGGEADVSFDSEDPIAQDELLKGGIETRIGFADPRIVNAAHPDAGTYQAEVNREFSLVIRHGQWAWHGPLQKWVAGVSLNFEWSAIDYPGTEYDYTSVSLEPLPPEEADNCPAGYHWNGSPGTNAGNETDPLWTYGCEIDYFTQKESAVGYIDPDMERADTLGVAADDHFQIGTFLGRPMHVRFNRVVGVEFWAVWEAVINMDITITAAEYYPLP